MQHKDKQVTRRQFIKVLGGALGALTASAVPLSGMWHRVKADETTADTAGGGKLRQWCMVIDLRKCDGCVGLETPPQCLNACVLGHYVPQGMKWIEIFQPELPGGGSYFMPTPCYHCENAPCVNVCPVAATYHTESGIVLIDQRRCIGCRMCMGACPYHRRFFNWGTPQQPPEAALAEYSPTHQVPAFKGTVMKCDFCPDMMERGQLPYCVSACPRKVLYMGDLNEEFASNGVEVVKLPQFLDENNAYRYKEELGTQPRVYYLPGHGQESGRDADDPRPMLPTTWPWGGDGYYRKVSVWPWEEKP